MAYSVRELPSGTVLVLSAVSCVLSVVISLTVPVTILQYPFAAVAVASLLFGAYLLLPKYEHERLSLVASRVLEVSVFALILISYVISQLGGEPFSDWFYVTSFAAVALLGLRIIYGHRSQVVPLCQTLLLALVARTVLWYSSPVYGQDTRFHMGISSYMMNSGQLIPRDVIYYRFFPIGHALAAINAHLTGFEIKTAYFMATSVPQVISLIALYLLTRRIMDARHASLATLMYSFSSGALLRGTQPYVQTTATALTLIVLYLLLFSADRRYRLLVLMLIPIIVVTHNLAPLVLSGTAFFLLIFTSISTVKANSSIATPALRRASATVLAVSLPASIYYWILSDYIRFQINRVELIVSASRGTGQSEIESTNAALPPTTELFSVEFPEVLMWAAPILILILLLGFASYVLLQELIFEPEGDIDILWPVLSLTLFAGFAVAFAIGGQGPVIRALPAVSAIVAPVLALSIFRLSGLSRPVGTVLCLLLIVSIPFSGFLTPSVGIQERSPDDFAPVATHGEVEAVDFVKEYSTGSVHSDRYLATYSFWQTAGSGTVPSSPVVLSAVSNANVTTPENHRAMLMAEGRPILYRDSFRRYYGIRPLSDRSRIYSSGDTFVYATDSTAQNGSTQSLG